MESGIGIMLGVWSALLLPWSCKGILFTLCEAIQYVQRSLHPTLFPSQNFVHGFELGPELRGKVAPPKKRFDRENK